MDKPKQRSIYFTDKEWKEIQKAADKTERGNKSNFVSRVSLKAARRENK